MDASQCTVKMVFDRFATLYPVRDVKMCNLIAHTATLPLALWVHDVFAHVLPHIYSPAMHFFLSDALPLDPIHVEVARLMRQYWNVESPVWTEFQTMSNLLLTELLGVSPYTHLAPDVVRALCTLHVGRTSAVGRLVLQTLDVQVEGIDELLLDQWVCCILSYRRDTQSDRIDDMLSVMEDIPTSITIQMYMRYTIWVRMIGLHIGQRLCTLLQMTEDALYAWLLSYPTCMSTLPSVHMTELEWWCDLSQRVPDVKWQLSQLLGVSTDVKDMVWQLQLTVVAARIDRMQYSDIGNGEVACNKIFHSTYYRKWLHGMKLTSCTETVVLYVKVMSQIMQWSITHRSVPYNAIGRLDWSVVEYTTRAACLHLQLPCDPALIIPVTGMPMIGYEHMVDLSRASKSDMDDSTCSICLAVYDHVDGTAPDSELPRLVFVSPTCHHSGHLDCLKQWFNDNNCCPFCRTVVYIKQ
jgi:hypothetical protein